MNKSQKSSFSIESHDVVVALRVGNRSPIRSAVLSVEDDGWGSVLPVEDDGWGSVLSVEDDGWGSVLPVEDDGWGSVLSVEDDGGVHHE